MEQRLGLESCLAAFVDFVSFAVAYETCAAEFRSWNSSVTGAGS
jgi:hypothetical protein